MSSLALEISKSAIQLLADKVKNAIKEEAEQWQTVQSDLVFIKGEFEMMQAFLDMGDAQHVKNNVGRTWVRQVNDLSYDTEDWMEFVLHLDTKRSWWLRLRPSCMQGATLAPLDAAVAEMKQLKARAEDVSQRRMRYDLISDTGSNPVVRMQKRLVDSTKALDVFVKASEAEKDRIAVMQLKSLVHTADRDLKVVSVCGIGGDFGTTSIIRQVYDDSEIRSEFKLRVWLDLPNSNFFSMHKEFRMVKEPLFPDEEDDHEPLGVNLDNNLIMDSEKRFLLVLEGLSNLEEWDTYMSTMLRLKNGSRVIVSAKNLEIASLCTGRPYEISVIREFSAGHSICVFSQDNTSLEHSQGTQRDVDSWEVELEEYIHASPLKERGSVIFSWVKSDLVQAIYNRCEADKTFDKYAWIYGSHELDIEDICKILLLELTKNDSRIEDAATECQNVLHQNRCLVVIDGLESENRWESIKGILMSETSRSCIVVITSEHTVARRCATSVHDAAIHFFRKKGIQYGYAMMSISGEPPLPETASTSTSNILYGRKSEVKKLHKRIVLGHAYMEPLQVLSVWGLPGVGKTALVRSVYNICLGQAKFQKFAWVSVRQNFNINSFRLDLYFALWPTSRKEDFSIQNCLDNMRLFSCLVVIDGLDSETDWESIKISLLPDFTRRNKCSRPRICFVVTTRNESVAQYCVQKEEDLFRVDALHADGVHDFFNEGKGIQYGYAMSIGEPPLPETASTSMSNVLGGRRSEVKKLREQIVSGHTYMEPPHVLSVWGLPGVGKTALVRSVYNSICSDQASRFQKFAWVRARQFFNIDSFGLDLYFAFSPTSKKEDYSIQKCQETLRLYCCLLVIDGLDSETDWESIKISFLSRDLLDKSCLVVITRNESVARYCAQKEEDLFRVDALHADAVHDFFNEGKMDEHDKNKGPMAQGGQPGGPALGSVVTGEATSNSLRDMTEEAECIIHEFGRLPAVLQALRKYLATKPDVIQEIRRLKANFMQVLEINPELGELRDVLTQMHCSFNGFPQVLKKCTFYLSIFSQSSIIGRKRLARRWIAEGYSKGSNSTSMEDYTEKLFQKLLDLGIIEQPPQTITTLANDTRMTSFRIISLFLEYIMTRETEEKIFVPLEVTVLEGECFLNTERVGQHLAIRSSWKRDEIVLESLDFSRLRSLTVSGEWLPCLMMNDRMRVLRVLDLEGTSNLKDEDLKEIGEFLPLLKFLSLRGCKDITRLPASIRHLRLLQTLDIRGTGVVKLPRAIIKLRKLQYIRAGMMIWDHTGFDVSESSPEKKLPTPPVEETATPAPTAVVELPTPASSAEKQSQEASAEAEQAAPASSAEELPLPTASSTEKLPPPAASSAEVELRTAAHSTEMEQSPEIIVEEEQTPPAASSADMGLRTTAHSTETEQSPKIIVEEEQPPPVPSAEKEVPPSAPKSEEELQVPPIGIRTCPLLYSWFSKLRGRGHAGACSAGIKVPAGIVKLTALHTLGVVNVNTAGGRVILEELDKLTQLRKLGLLGIDRENRKHLPLVSSNLESLSLHFQKCKCQHFSECCRPNTPCVCTDDIELPRTLRSLKLYGYSERMPGSIKDLHSLMKLSLEMITLEQEDINILGKLEKLQTLRLHVNNVPDAKLQFCDSLFLGLQILDIASSTNRFDVMFSEGALAKLELLEVRCSPAVLQILELKHLISLKQVSLSGSYNGTLKEELEKQLADQHVKNPVLKLENN